MGGTSGGASVSRSAAIDAFSDHAERQRLLRSAYTHARYGWPESHAAAWERRLHTFEAYDAPSCRAAHFLEALTGRQA